MMRFPCCSNLNAAVAALLLMTSAATAQVAPGPYEILSPDEAYITEAWMDLNGASGLVSSDWTGYSYNNSGGYSAWNSPHAYPHHTGTDMSMQSGSTLRAPAAGTVTAVVNTIPLGTYQNNSGNYVKVRADATAPSGEAIDFLTCHMSPGTVITVGQHVNTGDSLGLSDSTGQVDSEHLHFQTQRGSDSTNLCPFYYAHNKYPIMFNQTMTKQVGHVIRVTAASTPVRPDVGGYPPTGSSSVITTVYQDQLFFSSYWMQGYYRIFLPNDVSNRSGWVKAVDVEEIFTGTVIQPLPDGVTYTHTAALAAPYPIRASASSGAAQIGTIFFGGGRFVADQVSGGWYRIAVPGSATWGWVLPDSKMVVYPQLTNPSQSLASLPNNEFPLQNNFIATGTTMYGRPKFRRCDVRSFSPAPTGGDGLALFLTDAVNIGVASGKIESIMVGKPNHRNYYVQADVYLNYKGGSVGWERYGILFRDDGFTGMTKTYEGRGNSYCITYDSDDGRFRCGIYSNSVVTDWLTTQRYITTSGWHRLRIEGNGDTISYYLDGTLQVSRADTTFPSGPCAMAYENSFTTPPSNRGAYFDNFIADALPGASVSDWAMY